MIDPHDAPPAVPALPSAACLPAAARFATLAAILLAGAIVVAGCGDRGSADRPGGRAHHQAGVRAWSGVVTRVSDGDTLWIAPTGGGAPRKVRITGIDAPESCQRGGAAAGAALRAKVLRRPVQVATRALDEYRRELATVQLDGQDLGAWLVMQGHAWSYRWRRDPGPYQREEQQARRAARGLFADPQPVNPREFRRTHGPC